MALFPIKIRPDHPNGHDVYHAPVTDFRSCRTSFCCRPWKPAWRGGRCWVTRSSLASTSKSLEQMNKSPDVGQATKEAVKSGGSRPAYSRTREGYKHNGSPSGGISNARRHRLHGRGQSFGFLLLSLVEERQRRKPRRSAKGNRSAGGSKSAEGRNIGAIHRQRN